MHVLILESVLLVVIDVVRKSASFTMNSVTWYLHSFVFILLTLSTTSATGPLMFSVAEESPVGTEVGVVTQQQFDEDPRPVPAELRYKIRSSSSSSRYFHLDELTGLLRTAEVLDREELCPYDPLCELVVDIIGTRNTMYSISP